MPLAAALLALALAGGATAVYFTLAYYGRVSSPEIPAALCRRDERSCLTILDTPYARLLGVPNSVLGLGFYAFTAALAALELAGEPPPWMWWVNLAAAAGMVLTAPYLIWALVARLKVWCRL